jgi:hypothetical protein
MVGVVTDSPAGQRFEPRDTKVVVAPGAVSMPYRSASAASSRVIDSRASGVGGCAV